MPSASSYNASRTAGAMPQPMRWRASATRTPVVAASTTGPVEAVDRFDLAFHVFCLWTLVLLARPQDYVAALVPST